MKKNSCFSCGYEANHIDVITDKAVCDTCWGDGNEIN